MLMANDAQHMARAIQLARRGLYSTKPNPRVGAVLVKGKGIVGEGWHRIAGEAHAETLALFQAGEDAKGSTCFVTLEPCNHQGKTGPCTDALISAGVKRVVFGQEDPNPINAGAGIERLREAGVEVDGPLMEADCRELNPGFNLRMTQGRPFVRIKMAMSLDGRTAMPDGDAFWITGPKARADVQQWRARSCAVVSGWRSIDRDEARMTVRAEEVDDINEYWTGRQPLRVVLDSHLNLPQSARFFDELDATWLIAKLEKDEQHERGSLIRINQVEGRVDLRELLKYLADQQINEVLVEAGPTLAGAFLRRGLVDEMVLYVAPKLMGSGSRPLFDLPLQQMVEALPLHYREIRYFGQDIRILASLETD